MDDLKRWIVVVPEQIISAGDERDAAGRVYALGLAGVEAEAQGLRRPDASWHSFVIEPGEAGAPPILTPDAALAVMVAMDRGAEEGEPTASRAGIDDPAVLPPGYSRTTGPWEPRQDDDYGDDPSPWRSLPDPECSVNDLVWVTFSERRGVRLARTAELRRWADGSLHWYTQGIGAHEIELSDVLAWMPLPEPWRGGR